MIVEDVVKVKWNGTSRKHYEMLGYKYTKKDDVFYVKASELSPSSNAVIRFICDYCGGIGQKRNDSLRKAREVLEKDCCRRCAPKKHLETLLLNGSLKSKFPEVAKEWSSDNEIPADKITPHSGTVGKWVCKNGHRWRAVVYSRTCANTGCPICNESVGEKAVSRVLEELDVNFAREYIFKDLNGIGGSPLRFDFAVLDNKRKVIGLIEFDGIYHYEKRFEDDGHEMLVKHDLMKNEYCADKNIPLLRIHYSQMDDVPTLVKSFLDKTNAEQAYVRN